MKEKTQEQIGKLIKSGERDAIHIAVMPVVAHAELNVGEDIGHSNGKSTSENPIGIVDPFLKETVEEGEMFYMFLYPNSITSLRHMWTHPKIAEETIIAPPSKGASEAWLRDFAANADCPSYEILVAAVNGLPINSVKGYEDDDYSSYRIEDGYFFFNNLDAHSEIPDEFWVHMENVVGRKLKNSEKPSSFSCSC